MNINKFLIIAGVIISIIIILFFYYEIKKVKNIAIPNYQQILKLENRINDIENSKTNIYSNKNICSPIMSLTYNTDMVLEKQGDLFINDNNLSDSETKKIINKIVESEYSYNKLRTIVPGDFSDIKKNNEFNIDIIKSISESIQHSDFLSENSHSEAPITPKHNKNKLIKNNRLSG